MQSSTAGYRSMPAHGSASFHCHPRSSPWQDRTQSATREMHFLHFQTEICDDFAHIDEAAARSLAQSPCTEGRRAHLGTAGSTALHCGPAAQHKLALSQTVSYS